MMPRPVEQHPSGRDHSPPLAPPSSPQVGFGLGRGHAGAAAVAPAAAPVVELDLGEVALRIEDGLLMAFGPQGDPLPPAAFVAAAGRQPAAATRLADGTPVAPLRVAAVLEAQAAGALAAAADGAAADAWIRAMLGLGPQPEAAAAAELRAEQELCELTAFGRELMIALPAGGPFLIAEARDLRQGSAALLLESGEAVAVGRLIERLRAELTPAAGELALSELGIAASGGAILLQLPALGTVRLVDRGVAADGARVSIFRGNGETAVVADLVAALGALTAAAGPADPATPADDPSAGEATALPFDLPAALSAAADGTVDLAALGAAVARSDAQLASLSVAGMPAAAALSAGLRHDDGSWSLAAEDLDGLQLHLPPAAGELTLEITLRALQGSATGSVAIRRPEGDQAARQVGPHQPTPQADASEPAPAVPAHGALGRPPVPLAIRPPLAAGVEARQLAVVMIAGLPEGARLSAGLDNRDGSWTLSPKDLVGLELLPAARGPRELVLQVTAVAVKNREGELASAADEVRVVLEPAAPIALAIDPALLRRDGAALDALVIRDLPRGARLSGGTFDPAIDGWVLLPRQLEGLTLTPAAGQRAFELTVLGVAVGAAGRPQAQVLTRLRVAPA